MLGDGNGETQGLVPALEFIVQVSALLVMVGAGYVKIFIGFIGRRLNSKSPPITTGDGTIEH